MESTRKNDLITILLNIKQAIVLKQEKELFDLIRLFISFGVEAVSSFDYPFSSKDETENQPIKLILSVSSPNQELQQIQMVLRSQDVNQMLGKLSLALELSLIEIWKNCQVKREGDYDIISQFYWLAKILINEIKYRIRPSDKVNDLSFISGKSKENPQTLFGKKPKKGSFLFPEKYICMMLIRFWSVDNDSVPYLTTREKELLKIKKHAKNTQLSRPIDQDNPIKDGDYLFILTPKGGLYVCNSDDGDIYSGLHHSTLRAGQPVICAGFIEIINGRIASLDDSSGHYRSPAENLLIGCIHLYCQGLLSKDCIICPMNSDLYPNEITCEQLLNDELYSSVRDDYYQISKNIPVTENISVRII